MTEPEAQSAYGLKFRIMLQVIPHPDGGYWTGSKMKAATGNVVGASTFTSLKSGAIDIPRADKIEAIAAAMRFPVELWFKDLSWWQAVHSRWASGESIDEYLERSEDSDHSIARMNTLVNRLFEERTNRRTNQPFTEQEVAEESGGALSEEEIRALRSGDLVDPTWGQLLALASTFSVGLSYFNGSEAAPLPLSLQASENEDDSESYITFRNSVGMNKQKRSLLRSMSEHLRRENKPTDSDEA